MPRLTLVVSFVLACVVLGAAQSSGTTATTRPQRGASAIAFLNQAVNAAGGSSPISAVQDFTAQGSITHYWEDNPEQGQLTVKSRGSSQFRIDSVLPEGTWAAITNSSLGEVSFPDGTASSIPPHNLLNNGNLTLPIVKVNAALLDQTQTIIDMGLVQFGSGQARQIEIQQNLQPDPTDTFSKLTRMDYFFDPSSLLLLRVRTVLHPNTDMVSGGNNLVLDFANYQSVNGILVPFSIRQAVAGQQIWAMQLSTVAFNTGLSDSDFQF